MGSEADLSVVYSGQVDAVLAAADRPQPTTTLDVLYDLALQAGVDARTTVLDVGCATGWRSRRLIERTGCRVEGVEYLPQLITWGREQTEAEGLQHRLSFEQGSILELPRPDRSVDVLWCTDVLSIIEDLDRAVDECARVLRPGGFMISHVSLATDRMAPIEQHELAAQGCVPASMDRTNVERSFRRHFTVEHAVPLGAQHVLRNVETGDLTAQQNLVRAARLLTWPERYRDVAGATAYDAALGEAFWTVFQLLGKIDPIGYLLRRRDW